MKKKAIRMKSDEGFSVIALIIMSIFAVICVIPFLLIVSGSLSSEMAITVNGYRRLPIRIFGQEKQPFFVVLD